MNATAAAAFSRSLDIFGQDWTLTRKTETGTHPGTGAPTFSSLENPVRLAVTWRKGSDTQNYSDDAAGAAYALPGALQAGDELNHPTHGKYLVMESGPVNHLGVYERAEIRAA